ncbi:MAG TPA: cation diffusion facilitator family transporter [Solirubrobacteraceae bacterium]|nr:cation diffusion facilitator family transporter [Solirubrobacteraceae bacterium]
MLPEADAGGHRRHLVMALVANASSAAVKLAAFAVTGASVLLSEGLHSIADCGNQAALMFGHRRAAAPPSAVHPLGRGRARYLWAFLVAVVVFGGGAVGSFVEATHRLLNPGEHPEIGLTLAALVVTGVIEGVSFASLVRAASVTRRAGEPWVGFVSRSRDPDLPVLLVEDVSDLVGLGLALTGTVLADVTGIAVLDVVASYLIAALLACNAVFLGREMASLVLGEAPEHAVEQAVLAAVNSQDGAWCATRVEAVHLGPDELLVIVGLDGLDGGGDAVEAGPVHWLLGAQGRAIAAARPLSARVVFDVSPDLPLLRQPPGPREDGGLADGGG